MRPSDLALDFGNPVAYYPGLVKYLGSVNAVLMFCQFFYLSGKESSSLGIYKSVEEIEMETGLSYREQATARKQLISRGVLIETHKRLEHKIYFRIDADRLDEIITENYVNSPNAQSAIGEDEIRNSGSADSDSGGEAKAHFDPTETTTETTTENVDGESAGADQPATQSEKMNYQLILDSYHELLPEMPQVKILTDSRKKHLRSFWKKFNFNEQRWQAYLSYIAVHCRWMLEDRPNGSGGFWKRKNLDYLITERCYVAVKEERANDK